MKIKLFFSFLFFTLLAINLSTAQNTKSFTIVSVDKEAVWPAVFKAFQELNLPRPSIAKQSGTGQTSYYNYKSLMIKNRQRFKLNYQDNNLTISIFERQYYTKSGWADNPLPMSKKQAAKILNPLKEQIIKFINEEDTITETPVTDTNQEVQINDSTEKPKTTEEYIYIGGPDPALGVAFFEGKFATGEKNNPSQDFGKFYINSEVAIEELLDEIMENDIQVVERVLFDKIVSELNIGSSELADPDSSAKLGKIVLAGFHIHTTFTDETTLNFRVIFTETGEVVYSNNLIIPNESKLTKIVILEGEKITSAIESFAYEKVLIIKENPKRYSPYSR